MLTVFSTANCEGCNVILLVGIVPDELLIPVPGINVWCAVPDEQRESLAEENKNESQKSLASKRLTLCLNCFTAYGKGKLQLSPETLRISIVRATYTEQEKHLKIGGPTKFVKILPDNPTNQAVTLISSKINTAKIIDADNDRITPEIGDVGRVTEISVLKNVVEVAPSKKVTENKPVVIKQEVEEKPVEKRIKIEVKEENGSRGEVNYLSVGTGFLGAVEMTDDDC